MDNAIQTEVRQGLQKIQRDIQFKGWCWTAIDDLCAMADSVGFMDLSFRIRAYVDAGKVYLNRDVETWMGELRAYVWPGGYTPGTVTPPAEQPATTFKPMAEYAGRMCACGNPLEKRKKMCAECKEKKYPNRHSGCPTPGCGKPRAKYKKYCEVCRATKVRGNGNGKGCGRCGGPREPRKQFCTPCKEIQRVEAIARAKAVRDAKNGK